MYNDCLKEHPRVKNDVTDQYPRKNTHDAKKYCGYEEPTCAELVLHLDKLAPLPKV